MILYKKRRKYKYNLHSKLEFETGIIVEGLSDNVATVENRDKVKMVEIDAKGKLTIQKGYSWDGPSGPTIDTKNFMQGSLIHDALYQLMREGVLPQHARKRADEILRDVCRKDGMSKFRSWYVYTVVRIAGASAARPDMLAAP